MAESHASDKPFAQIYTDSQKPLMHGGLIYCDMELNMCVGAWADGPSTYFGPLVVAKGPPREVFHLYSSHFLRVGLQFFRNKNIYRLYHETSKFCRIKLR